MKTQDIKARFLSKIKISETSFYNGTPCWEWQAFKNDSGYGTFWFNGSMRLAHRVSYHLFVSELAFPGSIKEPTDHLCRNPGCVSHDHLDPVTSQVNALRGVGPTAINAAKTSCKRGHAFTEGNTKFAKSGSRICVICDKAAKKESRKRRRQQRAEYNRRWLAAHPGYMKKYNGSKQLEAQAAGRKG